MIFVVASRALSGRVPTGAAAKVAVVVRTFVITADQGSLNLTDRHVDTGVMAAAIGRTVHRHASVPPPRRCCSLSLGRSLGTATAASRISASSPRERRAAAAAAAPTTTTTSRPYREVVAVVVVVVGTFEGFFEIQLEPRVGLLAGGTGAAAAGGAALPSPSSSPSPGPSSSQLLARACACVKVDTCPADLRTRSRTGRGRNTDRYRTVVVVGRALVVTVAIKSCLVALAT